MQNWTISSVLDIIFPNYCLVCDEILQNQENFVCWACISDLEFAQNHFYTQNELSDLVVSQFPIHKVASFMIFRPGGVLQKMLYQLKYQKNKEIGHWLGQQMGDHLSDWLAEIDVLIPVPIHTTRRKKRGYNQSEIIAEGIVECTRLALDSQSLTKIRHNESQTNKTKLERIENVKGAYALSPTHDLDGKNILLLDDVITTGSTTLACVEELYSKSKPSSVSLLYVASQNFL